MFDADLNNVLKYNNNEYRYNMIFYYVFLKFIRYNTIYITYLISLDSRTHTKDK